MFPTVNCVQIRAVALPLKSEPTSQIVRYPQTRYQPEPVSMVAIMNRTIAATEIAQSASAHIAHLVGLIRPTHAATTRRQRIAVPMSSYLP